MPNGRVRPALLEAALEEADGFTFEEFGNSFLGAIRGESFVPLGKNQDGGADAFLDEPPAEVTGEKIKLFYQASRQKDEKAKIRHTVRRLKEFGREPDKVIYVTSRNVKHIDQVCEELEEELCVRIAIRDRGYIMSHINDNEGTKDAYHNYLAPINDRLALSSTTVDSPLSDAITHPEVYLFLSKEYSGDGSNEALIKSVTDTLILWALEGTDPEKSIFLTKEQLEEKITKSFGEKIFKALKGLIPYRLKALSVSPKENRRIRVHKKSSYALPYETRESIKDQNAEDVTLRAAILDILEQRCENFLPDKNKDASEDCSTIAYDSLVKCFEYEGLQLYNFLDSACEVDDVKISISDIVDDVIEARRIKDKEYIIKDAVIKSIHDSFYKGTPEEKRLFEKLSKAYTIFFMLKADPKITEYFSKMKSKFHILVGTEIILEALSEISLNNLDQPTINTLKAISKAGGKLYLTDMVANEVITHIQATDYEFINKYQWAENNFDFYTRQQADRILIQSYLRAKSEPAEGKEAPKNWEAYLNGFVDYGELHKDRQAKDDIIRFLQFEFGLQHVSLDDVYDLFTDEDHVDVEQVFSSLKRHKKNEMLAKNDALMAVYTFCRRTEAAERSEICNLGYKTWWLTREKSILPHVQYLINRNCSKFMIRPEFLLNFIQLLPDAGQVRKSFGEAFPTTMSLALARHIEPGVFSNLMAELKIATEMKDSRRALAIRKLSDKLKGDFDKDYEYKSEEFTN